MAGPEGAPDLAVPTTPCVGRVEAWVRWRRRDQLGATAIEYALISAGIALAIVIGVFTIGDEVGNIFLDVQTNLQKR